MPREERMFGDVVDRSVKVGNRQGVAVLLTVALETAVVSVLIVAPLMAIDVLPTPNEAIGAFVVQPPAPAAPSPPHVAPPSRTPSARPNPEAAPLEPPDDLLPEPPLPHADFEAPAGVVIMLPDAFGGVEGGFDIAAPPPSPPPPAPVRVGGGIRPPQKTKHVTPLYPAVAQSARVQGTVIIEATIDLDGKVSDARVLRGHSLLDGEALAAVRQWEFTPTLLNGVPTPVIMTVTVNFRLN
jgi:protein TonB